MAVPNLATVATGDDISATYWNNTVEPAIEYMTATRPFCFAYQSVAQSPANNTATSITMDAEAADSTGGMHSIVTNTSRVILPELGWYTVTLCISWAANVTGDRLSSLYLNGALLGRTSGPACAGAAITTRYSFATHVQCTTAGTDYLEAVGQQTSGGALATAPGQYATFISAMWERS